MSLDKIIFWVTIGLLAIFLIYGLIMGLSRGLKRSSLHLLFFVTSAILAFLITVPITHLVLGLKIMSVDGVKVSLSDYITNMVQSNFDLSEFGALNMFVGAMPQAICAPIVFIVVFFLVYLIMDIIYAIVARVAFGKKKVDFKRHKPFRAYGAILGAVEGFLVLFLVFAPITSLTNTYAQIASAPASVQTLQDEQDKHLKPLSEYIGGVLPEEVDSAITAYNNSVVAKISGMGGLDNLIFDGLSGFKVDGEKIEFRKDVLTLADVYDVFVENYNAFLDNNFEKMSIDELKGTFGKFLDGGMFKKVVAETIKDFVIKFDDLKAQEKFSFLNDLPESAQKVINALKVKFAEADFDAGKTLKEDFDKLFDVANKIITKDSTGKNLIEKYMEIKDAGVKEIIGLVSENSEQIKGVLEDVLKLNLVSNAFEPIGEILSTQISNMLKDGIEDPDKLQLEIGLNLKLTEQQKETMFDEVVGILNEVIDGGVLDIVSSFTNISGDNFMQAFESIDKQTLVSAGKILDKIQGLAILNLPIEENVREKEVSVFDNIMKLYDIQLLGDTVMVEKEVTAEDSSPTEEDNLTEVKLDTYEKFFDFIGGPIELIKGLDIFGATEDENSNILGQFTDKLSENPNFLVDVLTPLFQLKVASIGVPGEVENEKVVKSIKELTFDPIIETIKGTAGEILNLEESGTYQLKDWKRELGDMGQALGALAGDFDAEKTLLDALLDTNSDKIEILNKLSKEEIEKLLNAVFDAKTFDKLTETIFTKIDEKIKDVTNVQPTTDTKKLSNETKRESAITTISGIVGLIGNGIDIQDLATVGQLLDILKEDAKIDNHKGVFSNIFENLIWYLTGDAINGTSFEGHEAMQYHAQIKEFLDVTDENYDQYYSINYEDILSGFSPDAIQKALDFAENLDEKLKSLTDGNNEQVIQELQSAIEELGETKDEIVQNLKDYVERTDTEVLTEEQKSQIGDKLKEAIEGEQGYSDELKQNLLDLFGLSAQGN